jgi:hypothetical protein
MSTPSKLPITPVSAAPSTPLTLEQKRAQFALLRQRMGRSQIEVTPPAGKSGYWAPLDDTRELGRLDWLGFKIVHDNPKSPIWQANGAKEDGTYVVGDVILMEIDTWIYEMLQQEYIEINEAQRKNAPRNFQEEAERQGSPTFEVKTGSR